MGSVLQGLNFKGGRNGLINYSLAYIPAYAHTTPDAINLRRGSPGIETVSRSLG